MNSVNILILIDALGWSYIKDRSFLNDIAVTKRPVKSILGFSSGVIPSILTGKYPQEHKHWSLYYYSPQTSPFRWAKSLLWLPKKILNSRVSRKIIEEISKRIMGYSGYFETYLIPVEKLHLFDICENRNIYAPKGIRGSKSIFDILREKGIDYKCFTYPSKDKDILDDAKKSLQNRESSYYFLYLCESDAMLHHSCRDTSKVNNMIDYYENQVRGLYEIAREKYSDVNLYIFSDHSMASVNGSYDLKQEIDGLGFEMPKDYIVFYDSTMARFWFFNPIAKIGIMGLLRSKKYGQILVDDELETMGLKFENNMYGEVIFLMNTGSVICPSFMGSKAPQGMHGFGIDDGVMDAVLVSNKKMDIEIKDVKDFFKLMHEPANPLTKKIKVLHFLNSTVRGGVEEHVLRLIEGLDKNQFDPILVCPQYLIDLIKPELNSLKIKYYAVCIRRWRSFKEIVSLFNILEREKPDIVHSHLFFATMFAAPIAKLSGVPKVIDTSHIHEAWRKGIKKAYFIDRFFYKFVDKIIAVSHAVKKYLITEKKIPQGKIEVIHNGVDLKRFNSHENFTRHRRFTIGVIGRLELQKGHKYFLEAINFLNDNFKDARFIIVGDGKLRCDLENHSRELAIANRVEFLGYRKDIENVFKELDLLVLPSLFEGLPLVALEASAMGKPVIVTNVDGNPEVVQHNHTGLVIRPKDPLALANGMIFFMHNNEIARTYGENGRKFISENFDIVQQIKKTEELYKKP